MNMNETQRHHRQMLLNGCFKKKVTNKSQEKNYKLKEVLN